MLLPLTFGACSANFTLRELIVFLADGRSIWVGHSAVSPFS